MHFAKRRADGQVLAATSGRCNKHVAAALQGNVGSSWIALFEAQRESKGISVSCLRDGLMEEVYSQLLMQTPGSQQRLIAGIQMLLV